MAKVMVSLPEELVQQLDKEAKRRSTSRSGLLAEAARRELDRRDPLVIARAVQRSRARFAEAGSFEAADVVRADRDAMR